MLSHVANTTAKAQTKQRRRSSLAGPDHARAKHSPSSLEAKTPQNVEAQKYKADADLYKEQLKARDAAVRAAVAKGRQEGVALDSAAAVESKSDSCCRRCSGPCLLDTIRNGSIPQYHASKLAWDSWVCVIILYSVLVVPYRIGFSVDAVGFWYVFEWVVDGFFAADILVNFFAQYQDEQGLAVRDRWDIARHYARGWFVIDVLSTAPIDLIVNVVGDSQAARSLKLLRVLRLARLLKLVRLIKLGRLVDNMEELQEMLTLNPALVRLFKLLLQIMFMGHLFACGWFGVSTINVEPNAWVCHHELWHECPGSELWIGGPGSDLLTQYLKALYWCIATITTVGYGDVRAGNTTERLYSMVAMLAGASVFGFIIGNISTLLGSIDARTAAYKQKMEEVKEYLRDRKFPAALAKRVIKYFEYYMDRRSIFDEQLILMELSHNLRNQVVMQSNHDTISRIHFFKDQDKGFVTGVVTRMKPLFVVAGEQLAMENDVGKELYFLLKGTVEATVKHLLDSAPFPVIIGVYTAGHYFGDVSLLTNKGRPTSLVAVDHCDAFSLSKEDLEQTVYHFPDTRETMRAAAVKQLLSIDEAKASMLAALKAREKARLLAASANALAPSTKDLGEVSSGGLARMLKRFSSRGSDKSAGRRVGGGADDDVSSDAEGGDSKRGPRMGDNKVAPMPITASLASAADIGAAASSGGPAAKYAPSDGKSSAGAAESGSIEELSAEGDDKDRSAHTVVAIGAPAPGDGSGGAGESKASPSPHGPLASPPRATVAAPPVGGAATPSGASGAAAGAGAGAGDGDDGDDGDDGSDLADEFEDGEAADREIEEHAKSQLEGEAQKSLLAFQSATDRAIDITAGSTTGGAGFMGTSIGGPPSAFGGAFHSAMRTGAGSGRLGGSGKGIGIGARRVPGFGSPGARLPRISTAERPDMPTFGVADEDPLKDVDDEELANRVQVSVPGTADFSQLLMASVRRGVDMAPDETGLHLGRKGSGKSVKSVDTAPMNPLDEKIADATKTLARSNSVYGAVLSSALRKRPALLDEPFIFVNESLRPLRLVPDTWLQEETVDNMAEMLRSNVPMPGDDEGGEGTAASRLVRHATASGAKWLHAHTGLQLGATRWANKSRTGRLGRLAAAAAEQVRRRSRTLLPGGGGNLQSLPSSVPEEGTPSKLAGAAAGAGATPVSSDGDSRRIPSGSAVVGRQSISRVSGNRRAPEDKPWHVVNPQSKGKLTWDMGLAVLILYSVVIIPFRIGFDVNAVGVVRAFDRVVDIFFVLDMCVNFRTEFQSGFDEDWVWETKDMALNYLRHWFIIDLLSTVPVDSIVEGITGSDDATEFRSFRLVRVLRLFRLLKLARLVKLNKFMVMMEEKYHLSPAVLRLAKLFFEVMFIAHLTSCFFFFVSTLDPDARFMWWQQEYTPLNIARDSLAELYLASLYFAYTTMTTVGYGDIVAMNNPEMIFTIVCMIMGATVFGYIVGSMASIVNRLNYGDARYKEKMDAVSQYMRERNLTPDLRKKVRRYYEYYLSRKSAFDENLILSELSDNLKREAIMHLNKDIITKIPFFEAQSEGFISFVMSIMFPMFCVPHDYIFLEDEIGLEMYFLVKGSVVVVSKAETPEEQVLKKLDEGSFFGEIAILCATRRTASIRAVTYCNLFTLQKDDLDVMIVHYPTLATMMQDSIKKKMTTMWTNTATQSRFKKAARRAALLASKSGLHKLKAAAKGPLTDPKNASAVDKAAAEDGSAVEGSVDAETTLGDEEHPDTRHLDALESGLSYFERVPEKGRNTRGEGIRALSEGLALKPMDEGADSASDDGE